MKTYFMQSEIGGPIKIGVSECPESRLDNIQTCFPYKIKLLLTLNGNIEAELHQKFERHCIRGEWFREDEEIYKFIKQHHGKKIREKRNNLWEGLDSKIDFVERYYDIIYDNLEEADEIKFIKWAQYDEDCRVSRLLQKIEIRKNKGKNTIYLENREKLLLDMFCDCPDSCCESCEHERKTWLIAIDLICNCTHIIEKIGINIDKGEFWVLCKPLTTRERNYEYYDLLINAADYLDEVGWRLFSNSPNEYSNNDKIVDMFMLMLQLRYHIEFKIQGVGGSEKTR